MRHEIIRLCTIQLSEDEASILIHILQNPTTDYEPPSEEEVRDNLFTILKTFLQGEQPADSSEHTDAKHCQGHSDE